MSRKIVVLAAIAGFAVPCAAQTQINQGQNTAEELKKMQSVATAISHAWSDFEAGKLSGLREELAALRATPQDPNTVAQRLAREQADMLEARWDMADGKYRAASDLFEKHLELDPNAHSDPKDPYFNLGRDDLRVGADSFARQFRLGDLAICLAHLGRYEEALMVYRAGLRTLWDGSKLEVESEPVPMTETFESGLSTANLPRFDAACDLMAAMSTQQNGNEEQMVAYARKAAIVDPTWELARFYSAYLPLEFGLADPDTRTQVYSQGVAACSTDAYRTILLHAYKREKFSAIGDGADVRGQSPTLIADLKRIQHAGQSGATLIK